MSFAITRTERGFIWTDNHTGISGTPQPTETDARRDRAARIEKESRRWHDDGTPPTLSFFTLGHPSRRARRAMARRARRH